MLKLSHQISIPQTKPAWPPSEAWRNLVSQILEELALYIPNFTNSQKCLFLSNRLSKTHTVGQKAPHYGAKGPIPGGPKGPPALRRG